MKRPIKPFVVEVRKGQKKADEAAPSSEPKAPVKPSPRNDSGGEALRRAEAALFSRESAPAEAPPARTGRILASLDEPPAKIEEPAPARRRGRPPGSLNKPKGQTPKEAGPPKRRGRPRKYPLEPVRQITPGPAPLTAEPPLPLEAEPVAASPKQLPRHLQSLIGLDRAEVAARLARVPAGERWKRRLRGPARIAFERRHTKA